MLQILRKLRDWWNPQPKRDPGARRVKNYSSETGFQYQYKLQESAVGDYVFHIWTTGVPVHVLRITVPLPQLPSRDRYALAKLQLFETLDEHAPATLPRSLEVTSTAALDRL